MENPEDGKVLPLQQNRSRLDLTMTVDDSSDELTAASMTARLERVVREAKAEVVEIEKFELRKRQENGTPMSFGNIRKSEADFLEDQLFLEKEAQLISRLNDELGLGLTLGGEMGFDNGQIRSYKNGGLRIVMSRAVSPIPNDDFHFGHGASWHDGVVMEEGKIPNDARWYHKPWRDKGLYTESVVIGIRPDGTYKKVLHSSPIINGRGGNGLGTEIWFDSKTEETTELRDLANYESTYGQRIGYDDLIPSDFDPIAGEKSKMKWEAFETEWPSDPQ